MRFDRGDNKRKYIGGNCGINGHMYVSSRGNEKKRESGKKEARRRRRKVYLRRAAEPRRRVTLSPVMTVIVFILLYRNRSAALCVIHCERRAYYESHLWPWREATS